MFLFKLLILAAALGGLYTYIDYIGTTTAAQALTAGAAVVGLAIVSLLKGA